MRQDRKSIFQKLSNKISFYSAYAHAVLLKSGRTFSFQGKNYHYFIHHYNPTWRNERTVEVPIVWSMVKKCNGKKILEVGNVLSHYLPVSHNVLDKYEKSPGVLNEDVVDYKPAEKYDLIVSISTLEHVGFDEKNKEPDKIRGAIENLKKCLSDGGKIAVTLPVGYNPELDRLIDEKKLGFTEQYFLKRVSEDNNWTETTWDDVKNSEYAEPYPFANAIVVGIIRK